jgi:hypothetical protein
MPTEADTRVATDYPAFAIDDFAVARGLRFGFLHLDLEGGEAEALRGARRLLARDAPVISFELHVHVNRTAAGELLNLVSSLGYDSFLVEEICGMRADCRNFLAIPRRRERAFAGSPTLDLATLGKTLFPVDATTISAHAFPCCARGGACCPGHQHCCTHWAVEQWMRHSGADLQWFTRNRWYEQRSFGWAPVRYAVPGLRARMARAPNRSGFAFDWQDNTAAAPATGPAPAPSSMPPPAAAPAHAPVDALAHPDRRRPEKRLSRRGASASATTRPRTKVHKSRTGVEQLE